MICAHGTRYAAAAAALAAAFSLQPGFTPRAQGAGLLIADGGLGGVLTIEQHTARVTINNGVAVTEVEQTFRNTEDRQVEALYVFPVPRGASVANFSMWIGGKEMVGEVVEKQRAKQVYESYKQTNTDPGLLEQKDYKTFEMRVFPIAPRGEQRVRVCYYQELDYDANRATYVYPLASSASGAGAGASAGGGRAGGEKAGRLSLSFRVLSETPVTSLESPSHAGEFAVAQHSPHFCEASYEARGGRLDRDFVLSYETARAQTGVDLITSRPTAGEDGYFMLTVTAGDELAADQEPADYVFLLDVSGSMAYGQKLGVSRGSIASFIEALSPRDRVELMTFNQSPTTLFGQLRPATPETLAEATAFLASQRARGGTVLRHALQAAYQYATPDRPLNVVLMSDGMTEQWGQHELLQLLRQRPANATVFTVGVGNEVNRPLLEQLAEDAGGVAAFLSEGDDLARQAAAFRRKLTRPAATGLRLEVAGVTAYDTTPAELPSLYHGKPVRVYGRYRGDGPFDIRLKAEVLGAPYAQSAVLPPSGEDNSEIERMWAQQKIESLLKAADRAGDRSVVRPQVVSLAEAYSIITEYTSFIVLENDQEYRRWKIDRKNATRLDRDHKSRESLERRLEELREQSLAQLGPQPADEQGEQPAPAPMVKISGDHTAAEAPEPGTALLLLLGLGPLLLGRRRRR